MKFTVLVKVYNLFISVILWKLLYCELVVNVQPKGGEIFSEVLKANSTAGTVTIEYLDTDAVFYEILMDFRSEVQIYCSLVPGEEELGNTGFIRQCFVVDFDKRLYLSPETMSRMRQRNVDNVRVAEEDKGEIPYLLDLELDPESSKAISVHLPTFAAKSSVYTSEATLQFVSRVLRVSLSSLMSSARFLPSMTERCAQMSASNNSCACVWRQCLTWIPCGIKYCPSKTGSKQYRCGINTCSRCVQFTYNVKNRSDCAYPIQ